MILKALRLVPATVVLGFALGGCQAFLPRDEDPVLPPAFAVNVQSGPSSQRLDEDGYPMIGAYPSAAAAQARTETVESTRARFAHVERRGAGSTAGDYQRSVQDLRARGAQAAASGEANASGSVDELRAIAERQRQAAPAPAQE